MAKEYTRIYKIAQNNASKDDAYADTRATHLEVRIYYKKDSTQRLPRGYYLSVAPVQRQMSGLTICAPVASRLILLQEVSRKSDKVYEKLRADMDFYMETEVSRFCHEKGYVINKDSFAEKNKDA